MKKLYVLLSLALAGLTASAQLNLSGTSYAQNFDTIGNGLPAGWACYSAATSTSLGTVYAYTGGAKFGAYYDTLNGCAADVFGHGFKNCASADTAKDTSTCAEQQLFKNRALGVRQSSATGFDPGVSFALQLANTTHLTNFGMIFKLQGLDIRSPRTTTWTVDYGIGAAPTTFTPVTPISGTLTTGNSQFTNNTIIVNFGSALDNISGPVWIRISSLSKTTGAGNRTTSAIDDFYLSYVPNGIDALSSEQITFKVLGSATANNVRFTCNIQNPGKYTLNIYDITGRQVCSKQVELNPGTQNTISVSNQNLVAGMYIARITDGSVLGITKVIVQ